MTGIEQETIPLSSISGLLRMPDLYRGVIPPRSDMFAIGRPSYRSDLITMLFVYKYGAMRIIVDRPYTHRLVVACRSNMLAVGGPCEGINPVSMCSISVVKKTAIKPILRG